MNMTYLGLFGGAGAAVALEACPSVCPVESGQPRAGNLSSPQTCVTCVTKRLGWYLYLCICTKTNVHTHIYIYIHTHTERYAVHCTCIDTYIYASE